MNLYSPMHRTSSVKGGGVVGGNLTVTGNLTIQGTTTSVVNQTTSGTITVTVANANALAVGPNGTTNPTLQIDTSTASAATGLAVIGAAAAGNVALNVVSSGTDEGLQINPKGTGSVGIAVAPVAGCRLTLPQENDAATPTFSFGDGDTGAYESSDDNLKWSIDGTARWTMTVTILGSSSANHPRLTRAVPSATVPTLNPRGTDDNTGIGWATDDQLSLIAGGVEGLRVEGTAVTFQTYAVLDITDTNGTIEGSLWYDASEDKLKFKTAAGVETITSS